VRSNPPPIANRHGNAGIGPDPPENDATKRASENTHPRVEPGRTDVDNWSVAALGPIDLPLSRREATSVGGRMREKGGLENIGSPRGIEFSEAQSGETVTEGHEVWVPVGR
jgi:hypothetical protein